MKELLKKVKKNSLVTAIFYTVLGGVLLFLPNLSTNILCTALGLVLLICGVVDIVTFLVNRDGSLYASSHLIAGVILAAVGVWIMNRPALIAVIIPRVIGILICIHGVSDIKDAFSLQHNHDRRWGTALLLGVLTLVLGGILLYDPFSAFTTVIQIIGAFLLYDGISDIWIAGRVGKSVRQMKKDLDAEAGAVDVDYTDADK